MTAGVCSLLPYNTGCTHRLHAFIKKVLSFFIFCSFLKFIVLSPGFDLWDKMVNNTSMS